LFTNARDNDLSQLTNGYLTPASARRYPNYFSNAPAVSKAHDTRPKFLVQVSRTRNLTRNMYRLSCILVRDFSRARNLDRLERVLFLTRNLASRDSNEFLSLASSCLYIVLRDNCAFIYTAVHKNVHLLFFLQ